MRQTVLSRKIMKVVHILTIPVERVGSTKGRTIVFLGGSFCRWHLAFVQFPHPIVLSSLLGFNERERERERERTENTYDENLWPEEFII